MYTRSEVIALMLVVLMWGGALLLFSLLLYARTKFGIGKSRTIAAILIDIGMTFAAAVVLIGALPFVRIFWALNDEPATTIVRFGNIAIVLLVILFADVRLFIFFLIGEGPMYWPWQLRRGHE